MKKGTGFIVLLTLLCISLDVSAQCKTFTKKECMPKLMPYIHNGQMNNITLFPGEHASLQQTFYSGQNYRIVVCAAEILGEGTYFEIRTEDDELLHSSKGGENFWDFTIGSTQNLKINVEVPASEQEVEENGCVAVLVGFRDD